jgi:hypothetical protein
VTEDKRNKVDAWIIDKFRPFVRIWMEVVRNALVVGLLIFVARKSNSVTLLLLSTFTALLFGLYCLSYVQLSMPPYRSGASNRFIRLALNIGSLLFVAFVLWTWADLITKTLFQLADLQAK